MQRGEAARSQQRVAAALFVGWKKIVEKIYINAIVKHVQ